MVFNETIRPPRRFSEPRGSRSQYVERRTEPTRNGISKTGGCKPAPSRAKAKSGQAAFRFPRPCRLEIGICGFFSLLRGQPVIRQPLAGDFGAKEFESLRVCHVLARVVTEHLLVDVPEQVEGFHADIRALQAPLEQAPEVLHSIGMDLPVHVALSVINDRMSVFSQTLVRLQFVTIDRRSGFHMLTDMCLNCWLAPIWYDGSADFAMTLQNSGHDSLPEVVKLSGLVPPALMHVAGLAADHGFVCFDLTARSADLAARRLVLHCVANPMEHEPRCLLGDSKIAGDLATTHSVLATRKQPDDWKPLVETERTVFQNGSSLDAELSLRVSRLALPIPARSNEGSVRPSASWASYHTIRPATASKETQAVVSIAKVLNRLDKSQWKTSHDLILQEVA